MKITKELEDEIRRIIREEISYLITSDKKLEKTVSTYMKSLLYNEFHKVKLGQKNFQETEYSFDQNMFKRLKMTFGNDESIKIAYDKFISQKKMLCDFESFYSIMKNGYSENQIEWIDIIPRSKDINQQSIFDVYYDLDNEVLNFKDKVRKRFISIVCKNFNKGGHSLDPITLDNSFSKWKSKKIEKTEP
jgi:hypothetical protein